MTGEGGAPLAVRDVRWSAGGRLILDGVALDVAPGGTLGLLGPNGSGKSSLLRLLAGVRRAAGGAILLDGDDLAGLPRRRVAQRLALVEQHAETELDLTVLEVVRLGRIPHRRPWSGVGAEDDCAVAEAIARTGLQERLHQRWSTLSGGERQRVQIARALAQEPRELLLDEPTNHLDVHHQLDLLTLVAELPLTSVVALHDLNLAAMFCDRLVVLDAGRVVAAGTPAAVLTPRLIADVYRVRAVVGDDGPGGRPSIRFLPGRLRAPAPHDAAAPSAASTPPTTERTTAP
ncbi:ABC transporter ATP-binding protein [Patulibacter brassicae]|uniref:ABC transporter ATP-binding protein n=1 Tax=Patulibacter brassicae TaxID=1705717 RepID=A0ABU4VIS4_9ACTN|nr:ABC transporter ATP-binding protein [Patulibacter brassicae]MDX8150813.1 ABC transporter ATP-binding protein [Patulibacter brassicae]